MDNQKLMQHIFFVNKGNGGLNPEEVVAVFENTSDLETIKDAVEQANERLYVSWASVEAKDLAGEEIPIEDVINDQDVLLERGGPITDNHTNAVIGRTVAYKVLEHPETKTLGVLHLNRIFNHNPLDDQVWTEIVTEERKGSSVAGINMDAKETIDQKTGQKVRELIGFRQYETASVFDPCNPFALNEAYSLVAKSATAEKRGISQVQKNRIAELFKTLPDEFYKKMEDLVLTFLQEPHVQKNENVINKPTNKNTITNLEDNTMDTQAIEKLQKSVETGFNDISAKVDKTNEGVTALEKRVDSLEKSKKTEDNIVEDEERKPVDEEEKSKKSRKAEDEEKPDEEKPDEEDKKKTAKDAAASDIAGEAGSETGEEDAPSPDAPNDDDVVKNVADKVLKKLQPALDKINQNTQVVSKSSTPRAGSDKVAKSKEEEAFDNLPLDMAYGKVKKSAKELNLMLDSQAQTQFDASIGGQ